MIILIVEDLPEEQANAKKVAIEADFKPIVAPTRADAERLIEKMGEKIAGVVTDIHFPQSKEINRGNPNGLSVLAKAVDESIPVSVCSDINSHYCFYVTDVVNTLSRLSGSKIPLDINKNWPKAISELKSVIKDN